MFNRLEDAERTVRQVFLEEFPEANFNQWNRDLKDEYADGMIKDVGRASTINVRKFIEELW